MIEVSHRADVAVVQMIHGKANALDLDLCETMTARLEELKTSLSRAVVITGQGKIFSAGVDLLRALADGPIYLRKFLPALSTLFETVFLYPKPLVAAVNGHAIAGGCVLACAADRRLMARGSGRIGVTELLVGVPFPVIALEIMRSGTAPHLCAGSIFSGATFPPEEALARGFIDATIDADDLMERAVAGAQSLAALSPAAFALTKRQLRQAALDRCASDRLRFDAAIEEIWLAPETFARIEDYVARTLKKD